MDDSGSSKSWNKLVIADTNNQWIKTEQIDEEAEQTTAGFCLDYDPFSDINSDTKSETEDASNHGFQRSQDSKSSGPDVLLVSKKRMHNEAPSHRAERLAKMSAYAAQRLANESSEQRSVRLKRMSEYAAKRLANETREQRQERLSRMSAYAARRLAKETPEQRQERLARMSAYAARRHAMKKMINAANKLKATLSSDSVIIEESSANDTSK